MPADPIYRARRRRPKPVGAHRGLLTSLISGALILGGAIALIGYGFTVQPPPNSVAFVTGASSYSPVPRIFFATRDDGADGGSVEPAQVLRMQRSAGGGATSEDWDISPDYIALRSPASGFRVISLAAVYQSDEYSDDPTNMEPWDLDEASPDCTDICASSDEEWAEDEDSDQITDFAHDWIDLDADVWAGGPADALYWSPSGNAHDDEE